MRLEMMASKAAAGPVSPEVDRKRKLTVNGFDNPKRPCTRSSVRAAASRDTAAPSIATTTVRQPRIRMYFKDFYPIPPTAQRRNGIRFYRRNFFDQPRMIPVVEADIEKEVKEELEVRGGVRCWIKSEEDVDVKEERVEIKREAVEVKLEDVDIKKEEDIKVKGKEVEIEEHGVKIKKEESVDIKEEAVNVKKEEDFEVKEEVEEDERRTPKRQRKSRGAYALSVLAPSRGL